VDSNFADFVVAAIVAIVVEDQLLEKSVLLMHLSQESEIHIVSITFRYYIIHIKPIVIKTQ